MSWSLQLQHGDFAIGGARLGTVTGGRKLLQDIRCAILEKMGTDNLHPGYGSIIDGGITPDGAIANGVIGEADIDLAMIEVEAEINRITRDYQRQQLARAKQDKLIYGKATLDASEVLIDLQSLNFYQNQDTLFIQITYVTGIDGAPVSIDIPVGTDS